MFIFDDLILATVIVLFVLLATILTSGVLCFLTLLLGSAAAYLNKDYLNKESVYGGATKSHLKSIKKLKSNVTILLKSYKHYNKMFNPVNALVETYGYAKPKDQVVFNQKKLIDIAREIYKNEKADTTIFDLEYEKVLGAFENTAKEVELDISNQDIKKMMYYRLLEDKYLLTKSTSITGWNVKDIEYIPINKEEYETTLTKIFKYAVIASIRNYTESEAQDVKQLINNFTSGNLTEKQMKVHFFDNTTQLIDNCNIYQIKRPYSNIYKKLHWGQRKLLLSEIDLFNRVADIIGHDKFKKDNISLVYPGAAHGDHLLIEMEMYPNLILYLWDPAKYNEVLYIADFMRRGMDIPQQYSARHIEMAKKYSKRVFINMELSNETYTEYWTNSTTGNIPKNYITENGYFTKESADYFLKYRKEQNDKSPILFVSDIRLFTKDAAPSLLSKNIIKDFHDSIALKIITEKMRHEDYVRDMQLQKDWFEFVNADYGLFKFKLKTKNYIKEQDTQYQYLDGDIVLQAWAPVTSTETRLFVQKNPKVAYYNVKSYTDKLKTFNIVMRPRNMSNVTLKELGIKVVGNPEATMKDIFYGFETNLIGQDAVLETFILYDYLKLYKKEVLDTDLILIISDMTQTLLDHFNHDDILEYFKKSEPDELQIKLNNILTKRAKYHSTFSKRLDYNSPISDRFICNIKRSYESNYNKNYSNTSDNTHYNKKKS